MLLQSCGLLLLFWRGGLAASGPSEKPKDLPLNSPQVRSVFPLGGKAGQTVKVEIEGDFLDRASAVGCECTDVSGVVSRASALTLDVDVNIPASAEPGLRTLYVESPRGTSNRFYFRVTRWNSVREAEPNDRMDQAQAVSSGVVVEGRIARLTDVDFFKFHAQAGERLAFNVLAARSKAPGYVSIALLDGNGHELARKHSGVGPDPYLDYRFQDSGDYFVAVYPRRFADFFTVVKDDQLINWQYQLAIGRSPMLRSVFPAGAKRGTTLDLEVHADFLDSGATPVFSGKGITGETLESLGDGKFRMKVHIAADAQTGIHLLKFADESGNLGALGFWVSDGPEILQTEERPQKVTLPVIVNGRIRKPGEHDAYRIKANSDDAVTFRVDARDIGSQMTDPQIVLVRAEGDFSDSADERCKSCSGFYNTLLKKEMLDPQLMHAFISRSANDADAAGEYDVVVLDNSSNGSDDLTYRLTIRPQQPDFHTGVMTDHLIAPAGTAAAIPVTVAREEGFKGDVEIVAEGLPAGWTARPLNIRNGEESGELQIEGRGSARLALAARGKIGDVEVSRPVLVPPVSTDDGAGYLEEPRRMIQVSFVQQPAFLLSVEEPSAGFVIDSKKGPDVEIPCKIERCSHCQDGRMALQFEVEDAPPGVRVIRQQVAADGASAVVVLTAGSKQAEAGWHRIALRAHGRSREQEFSEVTAGIRLQVK